MPKSVWEKAGDEARQKIEQAADFAAAVNVQVDNEADSVLEKIKSSKFTGLIAVAALAVILLVVVL